MAKNLTKEQEEFLQEIHDLYFQSDFDMLMEHIYLMIVTMHGNKNLQIWDSLKVILEKV